MWVQWKYSGFAKAVDNCDVIGLKLEDINALLQQSPMISQLATEYAQQFCRRLSLARPPLAEYPDDLQVAWTDYCSIVSSCDPLVQKFVSIAALSQLSAYRYKRFQKLRDEVQSG